MSAGRARELARRRGASSWGERAASLAAESHIKEQSIMPRDFVVLTSTVRGGGHQMDRYPCDYTQ